MKAFAAHSVFSSIGLLLCAALLCGALPYVAHAQEANPDTVTYEKAQVVSVISQETKEIPGTGTSGDYQTIEVKVLDGADTGKVLTVSNDYLLLQAGDVFYLMHTVNTLESIDTYAVSEPYRIPTLEFFAGLFLLCLFVFGGKQGVRGLVSLIISFLCIIYILLPAILHGYSPVWVSVGVSSLIVIAGSYITHGFNKTTTAAVVGMLLTISITGVLAYAAIHSARLSGYTNEETVYLNFDTHGTINFVGLLLGSLMIGLLGVLYDAAISQAVAVEELFAVGAHLARKEIFLRALRLGREHIGALVNILAITYVGASLPLLLLFTLTASGSPITTINQELFATEILRTMIGSIGLILAVPVTTVIAVYMLSRGKEKASLPNGGERHTHSHIRAER